MSPAHEYVPPSGRNTSRRASMLFLCLLNSTEHGISKAYKSKAEDKYQESIQSSNIPDTILESDKNKSKNITHKRAKWSAISP